MDFFSRCVQICSFLRIWSHLQKKSLMENFTFCAVLTALNFCFLCFIVTQKRDYIRKKQIIRNNILMCNQYYYHYFDLLKIRVGQAGKQTIISCLCLGFKNGSQLFNLFKKYLL